MGRLEPWTLTDSFRAGRRELRGYKPGHWSMQSRAAFFQHGSMQCWPGASRWVRWWVFAVRALLSRGGFFIAGWSFVLLLSPRLSLSRPHSLVSGLCFPSGLSFCFSSCSPEEQMCDQESLMPLCTGILLPKVPPLVPHFKQLILLLTSSRDSWNSGGRAQPELAAVSPKLCADPLRIEVCLSCFGLIQHLKNSETGKGSVTFVPPPPASCGMSPGWWRLKLLKEFPSSKDSTDSGWSAG